MTEESWLWPIRIVTVLLSLTLLLALTATVTGLFFLRKASQTSSFADPVHILEVSTATGDIVVHAGRPGSPSTVQSRTTSAFRTAVHSEAVTGDVLKVAGSCQGSAVLTDECSVTFSIVVPPGTVVRATSKTGDITVVGIAGAVAVTTTYGDARLLGVAGPLQLTTSEGDVDGGDLRSPTVSAQTGNGDVDLKFATAPSIVGAHTNAGDIQIVVPHDKSHYVVEAETASGDRRVTVPTGTGVGKPSKIDATTTSGDVEVTYAR